MKETGIYTCKELGRITDRDLLHKLLDKIIDALEEGCDTPKIKFEHQLQDGSWRRASIYASVWRISDEEHFRQVEEYNKQHD